LRATELTVSSFKIEASSLIPTSGTALANSALSQWYIGGNPLDASFSQLEQA
jgi:hypothetical protein